MVSVSMFSMFWGEFIDRSIPEWGSICTFDGVEILALKWQSVGEGLKWQEEDSERLDAVDEEFGRPDSIDEVSLRGQDAVGGGSRKHEEYSKRLDEEFGRLDGSGLGR